MKKITRDSWLQIRVTPAEHESYQRAAGVVGLSKWARGVLDREAQRVLKRANTPAK